MQNNSERYHVILSGCSGGGKSTLLAELQRRGYETVEEPGRRIVAEEILRGGRALPWVDLEAFARRAIEMAASDHERVKNARGLVFYDRGLVDAAVALEHATGIPVSRTLNKQPRFHQQVFLVPPWPEIYRTDGERHQDFEEGVREYQRLLNAFRKLQYTTTILPKVDVKERAQLVLTSLLSR
ncbi:AAA family ATPase [Woodsholea maritima]|uniref:AAA family ATPase n=1 Tax=Woodsholea maritima TaxID=240237 RepID=UPI00036B79B5|nr:AAA family ATPase [Woodsholea maritima]